MIGFILGTGEGKRILSLANTFTDDIAVSTATKYGGEILKEYKFKTINTKPLNKQEMKSWILKNNIHILVDGSHPYAAEVTKNAIEISKELNIEYLRYERKGVLEHVSEGCIKRVKNYEEAIECIKNVKGNVLNTTGGNNAAKFAEINFDYRIIHRVLPMPSILSRLLEHKIKIEDIIALQGPVTYDLEKAFIKHFNIKALITKDSGENGGALEKYKAASDSGIMVIIIEKPFIKYDKVFYDEESVVQYLRDKIMNNRL